MRKVEAKDEWYIYNRSRRVAPALSKIETKEWLLDLPNPVGIRDRRRKTKKILPPLRPLLHYSTLYTQVGLVRKQGNDETVNGDGNWGSGLILFQARIMTCLGITTYVCSSHHAVHAFRQDESKHGSRVRCEMDTGYHRWSEETASSLHPYNLFDNYNYRNRHNASR